MRHSILNISVIVARNPAFFFYNAMLPFFLFVVLSFISLVRDGLSLGDKCAAPGGGGASIRLCSGCTDEQRAGLSHSIPYYVIPRQGPNYTSNGADWCVRTDRSSALEIVIIRHVCPQMTLLRLPGFFQMTDARPVLFTLLVAAAAYKIVMGGYMPTVSYLTLLDRCAADRHLSLPAARVLLYHVQILLCGLSVD